MVGVFLNVDGDGQRNHFGTICAWHSLSRSLIHVCRKGIQIVSEQPAVGVQCKADFGMSHGFLKHLDGGSRLDSESRIRMAKGVRSDICQARGGGCFVEEVGSPP